MLEVFDHESKVVDIDKNVSASTSSVILGIAGDDRKAFRALIEHVFPLGGIARVSN